MKLRSLLSFVVSLSVIILLIWVVFASAPREPVSTVQSGSLVGPIGIPSTQVATRVPEATILKTAMPPEDLVRRAAPPVQATTYARECTQSSPQAPFTTELCSELKAIVVKIEAFYADQTAQADRPTQDPRRSPTPRTPFPTYTPYVLSEDDMRIYPIVRGFPDEGQPFSEWRLGKVIGSKGEPYTVKLLSGKPTTRDGNIPYSFLMLNYIGIPDIDRDPALRDRTWKSDRQMGGLTILEITGLRGIVTFMGQDGQMGTFNLATEEWSYGERVATFTPTNTPTPYNR